jgi:pantoate--beta-alanine ligase
MPVGLVPTMGYLHQGHISLVKRARMECATVVVSVFVNPTQFGPKEDFDSYPRNLEKDLALLEDEGVDLVWIPSNEIMYPEGYQTWVQVDQVTQPLEGAKRPEHFRGVTTIVAKLFNAVMPEKAYFGQKDAQQVIVIQQMVRDLNFPLKVVVCPLIREKNGLAMSSRNSYLNPQERQAATALFQALKAAKSTYTLGEREAKVLRKTMIQKIHEEPLADLQYVSIANPITLDELITVDADALFSIAVFVGKTRLIDNFLLEEGQWHTGQTI